jgi:uncharacterized protein with HEPN domain
MRPDERDTAYLWDMLEAGREIIQFMAGTDQAGFAGEKTLRYAKEEIYTIDCLITSFLSLFL